MTAHRSLARVVAGLWVLAVLAGGCAESDQSESDASNGASGPSGSTGRVMPVSLPDLSSLEGWVEDMVRERHVVVRDLESEVLKASDAEIADAYGSLGLVLMAAEQYDAAAASYLNANALVPDDMRWPYYLGHLRVMTQDQTQAATWFERALELVPSNEAVLVSLARIYSDQGRYREAQRLFSHATTIEPRSAAAWAGLGQVALAEGDHRHAAQSFERALETDPGGTQVHYTLALAYQALGEVDLAATHFERRGGRGPDLTDPLMEAYNDVLERARVFEVRGNQALGQGNYRAAIGYFRRGLEVAPNDPTIRQQLAVALLNSGDRRGAVAQLEEAVRLAPDFAEAHVGLASLLQGDGRHAEAVDRYALAVKHRPGYVEARLGLAMALRVSGRVEESLPHFAQVAQAAPGIIETWVVGADALITLERYAEAREWVSRARRVHPDQPELKQLDEALAAMAGR